MSTCPVCGGFERPGHVCRVDLPDRFTWTDPSEIVPLTREQAERLKKLSTEERDKALKEMEERGELK